MCVKSVCVHIRVNTCFISDISVFFLCFLNTNGNDFYCFRLIIVIVLTVNGRSNLSDKDAITFSCNEVQNYPVNRSGIRKRMLLKRFKIAAALQIQYLFSV